MGLAFIELFAGIGGFRLGLESAGHRIVWANEWLESPRRIYRRHFGEYPDSRDVRTISPDELPDADAICGGFPCATFSLAGKRTGFSTDDARGTLFFEFVRFLRAKRYRYVLLENVAGLLNHDAGRTFTVILVSLSELGYDVQWEVCNSRNFGVWQNRERVFILGHRREERRPRIFPLGGTNLSDIEVGRGKREPVMPCILAEHGGFDLKLIKDVPDSAEPRADGKRWIDRPTRTRLIENPLFGDEEETYIDPEGFPHPDALSCIREITATECEKCQGLPVDYTKYYENGEEVSYAERHKRVGRSVTIPIIRAIGERLGRDFYEEGESNGQ